MCAPHRAGTQESSLPDSGSYKRERESWGSGLNRGRLLTVKPSPMWRRWGLVTGRWMESQELVPVQALSLPS